MWTYAWIVFVGVLGVSLSKQTKKPELEIHPAGLIKQGDNITITCAVVKDKLLDFSRLVRKVDAVQHEISSNKVLKNQFVETGRYRITKFETRNKVTTTELQIDNIQGRDGGNIGCLLLPRESGAFEDLKVHVPPKSVKLLHMLADGTEVEVPNDGVLQMRYGEDTAIMCRILVDGYDKSPKVAINFDEKNMLGSFIRDYSADDGADENGFLNLMWNATYKYMTNKPNKDYNGKQVTCSATMPHFPPVIAKAKLEILYPPELDCTQRLYAKAGTPDVKIACKGKMHPAPTLNEWSFGKGDNKTRLQSGQEEGVFVAQKEHLGGDTYEFSITVKEVEEDHFRSYTLKVTNGVGERKSLVRLVKEEEQSNAGRDSIAGRDGTNPPMSEEEMQIHGMAARPTLSMTTLLTVVSFVILTVNQAL